MALDKKGILVKIAWPDDLGRVARQQRLDLGLSQGDLAARAGVTRQWLTKFETAKSDVGLSKVLRVLRELDLAVDVIARPTPGATAKEPPTPLVFRPPKALMDEATMRTMNDNLARLSASARSAMDQLSSTPEFKETLKKLQASNRKTLASIDLPQITLPTITRKSAADEQ